MGQLGLGLQSPYVPSPSKIKFSGAPIKRISCGGEFSMIVDMRGNLFSFGHPEYGQLGHNNDGKYFVTSNKLTYNCEVAPRKVAVFVEKARDGHVSAINDVEIVDVACGANHSVAIDQKKRLYTWGFGGYGRLGHAEQKDELVPRVVKVFEGIRRGAVEIAAGSSFCLAVNECGGLFFWGQNKPTGEATMYPKPVMDLNGWKIRSIGCCNRSIVVAADDSVISWGSSPTYGELGYGDSKSKSSTTPQEMKLLDGVFIQKISCGYAHTILLARCDSDEEKTRLEKLPSFNPETAQ
ncbi:hypothetical protein CAPTEDRAFT_168471 [Capitella teleta]|uniref:Uncharacterized protein n=1 Tax=Capitella teleta TaxID=283909 RepID=R7UUQ4_CAPTE|nr:hypothetical protein CAPTEDRAFT_168471 [Capitella teleta]|eukprot:ELU07096.1 hypothetical protein CAPTEDRAFT_168471 [Capitella teleta]